MGNKSTRENPEDNAHPSEVEAPTDAELSYFQMAKLGYEQLVHAIIRPPRCQYEAKHLGPPIFPFAGRNIRRKDFELHNIRGLLVVCSLWEPEDRGDERLPCVIYMHGNSSARVEALPQLTLALSLGCTFFAFDFAGSGLSEGEYVSLGYFERDDLQIVIEYLRGTNMTSSIALWGRSMGAATALMHGERDPSIGAMILDSSFADLTLLAESMVEKGKEAGYSVPSFVVKLAIRFIRSSVQKAAHFDIKELSPLKHVASCFIPALFAAGSGDKFVPPSHSQLLYDSYAGEKSIHILDGDHNTPRPADFFQITAVFLIAALSIPDDRICREGLGFAGSGLGAWTVGKRITRLSSVGNKPVSVVEGVKIYRPIHDTKDGSAATDVLSFDEMLTLNLLVNTYLLQFTIYFLPVVCRSRMVI